MSESNKLINNGYLRAPHLSKTAKNGSNGNGNGSGSNGNNNSNSSSNGSGSNKTIVIDDSSSAAVPYQKQQQQQPHQMATNHTKLPTVVYLSGSGSGGFGGGGGCIGGGGGSGNGSGYVVSTATGHDIYSKHNADGGGGNTPLTTTSATAALTTATTLPATTAVPAPSTTTINMNTNTNTNTKHSGSDATQPHLQPQQPQQQQQQQSHNNNSEMLLKQPAALRRRLLVWTIVGTLLGAALGALTIYAAGGYRCVGHSSVDATSELGIGSGSVSGDDAGGGGGGGKHLTAGQPIAESSQARTNVCLTEECVRTAASLLSAMDTSADPCNNFFQYACGTWNKKHIIPEDRSSISTFEVLADEQQVILKGVLEEKIDEYDNKATIKAKMFYKSCMDIPQIRKVGEGRLLSVLQSLGGWPVIEPNWQPPEDMTLEYLMGVLRGNYSEPVLIDLYVGADDKNSSVNILQVDQMQLALPSRDYYLKASSENELKAYHKYMTQTAILLGADAETADRELTDVMQFEIKLVNVSLPEADRHDTSAIYKKITLADLQRQVPELNWTSYLQTALGPDVHLQPNEELVSYAMPYLIEMGKIVSAADRRVVHNYIIWRLIMSITSHMVDEYLRERVEFRKILLGIQAERMRWSQCVEWTNKKLGMAVGALFIRDNFNQESKDTALEMIHTIREAFNELLAENHWMDDETRAVAKEKADTMNERIGYPEILTDANELEKEYANLTIVADNFMENVLNILKWDSEKNLQLLRQPVDKEKWTTEPAVVNAFYNPNKNDIVFPAGILQPLFYSQNFPKSLNYGGIGVVIGHEITHGFDDKGRQFDKDGNMMQWWNNATIDAFRNRTQCIIDQYSKYKIDEVNMFMDGRMTQGENIADNGGLKQAFRAYKKWVHRYGEEQELPGLNLTHDQLFFLNYAQIWCGSMRPEDALTKIRSSVHSPGFIRVLGPLSNSNDFARAYHCTQGTPMNPQEKCNVW